MKRGTILRERVATMTSIEEFYVTAVRVRPARERLQLAAMILNDIAPQTGVEYSEEWTEEDVQEFRAASNMYALGMLEEEEHV
jgi:hypothetical protein